MSPSEIGNCLERANEVINGFKKPSERNARDVVALLKHFGAARQEPCKKTQNIDTPDFLKDLLKW